MGEVVRVSFEPSAVSALLHQAHDPIGDAVLDIGRGRIALRDLGVQTDDKQEAWQVYRQIQEAIKDLEISGQLVHRRYTQLEGYE